MDPKKSRFEAIKSHLQRAMHKLTALTPHASPSRGFEPKTFHSLEFYTAPLVTQRKSEGKGRSSLSNTVIVSSWL